MRKTCATLSALTVLCGGVLAAEGHRLSGTLSHSAVEDGVPAYFKLVAGDAQCTDPGPGVQAGQASFGGGEASYALEGVPAGDYVACFFIDTDDNVMETGGPTSGDYGAMKAVTLKKDTSVSVAESEWGRIP